MRLSLPWITQDYRIPAAIVGGSLFAAALVPVWNLPTRWFVVVLAGMAMVSASLIVVRKLDDFLLFSHLMLMPFASFQKWMFLEGYAEDVRNVAPISGAVSVGVTELLLVGMYAVWASQIFVSRTLPLPRLRKLDALILFFVFANLLSLPNAADPRLSLFALVHLFRHFFVYFYFSRRLESRHLPWIMVAFTFAIAAESLLGLFQYQTGMLKGLILDKGEGGEQLNYQYEVPGIENMTRATGTSYDSHTYGLFLAMLIPFPLAILLSSRLASWRTRLGYLALIAAGGMAVIVSFSRSAWLTCAVTCALVWAVFMIWREKHIILKTCALGLLALIPSPKALEFIANRFDHEGHQNLTARFDQYPVAWSMWKEHLWTGQGIGNYMYKLPEYYLPGTLDEPVHNVFLWLAADTGLLGAVAFFAIIGVAMWQLVPLVRARRAPIDLMALGTLAALTAYVIDGLSNPLFRESLVYMLFWFMLALSVALPRIQHEIDQRVRSKPTPRHV